MSAYTSTNTPGYFNLYIQQVPETNIASAFARQSHVISEWLPTITEQFSLLSYAPGKWTIRDILQHLSDTERILSYRALCFARNESAMLPGFDENVYAAAANANARNWESLLAEFIAVRKSTLFLFDSFSPEMLLKQGIANGNQYSVQDLGMTIAGHFYHHQKIIRERYLPLI